MRGRRLLYLGFAFPPGVQALHPAVNPAGHGFETQMVAGLRPHLEVRSCGLLPVKVPASMPGADPASGVAHEVILHAGRPTLVHRALALKRLQVRYRRWQREGWQPDAVLVYNLSPVYNHFVRWLRRQSARPRLVLLLLDSSRLGQVLPWLKRARSRLKPWAVADADMIRCFDGCIGLSPVAGRFCEPHDIPFLWMPGGCTPNRAAVSAGSAAARGEADPLHFGYFGALAAHSGVMALLEAFRSLELPGTLHQSGYGKLAEPIQVLADRDARVHFLGLLPSPDDCLRFGGTCDVLVNPRPASHGNENNFPSKIFEYALCGRAIVTTRLSGVDTVLGPEAFYCDADDLGPSLRAELRRLSTIPRTELHRRGAALRERVTTRFDWQRQAERMAQFIETVVAEPGVEVTRLRVPGAGS